MTSSLRQIPGYVVGTWDIDPTHSTVGFCVRHVMESKVRSSFTGFSGEIVTAADPTGSTVTASIDLDNHPRTTSRSTFVRTDGAETGSSTAG